MPYTSVFPAVAQQPLPAVAQQPLPLTAAPQRRGYTSVFEPEPGFETEPQFDPAPPPPAAQQPRGQHYEALAELAQTIPAGETERFRAASTMFDLLRDYGEDGDAWAPDVRNQFKSAGGVAFPELFGSFGETLVDEVKDWGEEISSDPDYWIDRASDRSVEDIDDPRIRQALVSARREFQAEMKDPKKRAEYDLAKRYESTKSLLAEDPSYASVFEQKRRRDEMRGMVPFIGTIDDMAETASLVLSASRIAEGKFKDEAQRESDLQKVASFLAQAELSEQEVQEGGITRRAGKILQQLPGFVGELAATGGVFTAGRQAARKALLKVAGGGVRARATARVGSVAAGSAAQLAVNPQMVGRSTAQQALGTALENIGSDEQQDSSFLAALPAGIADSYIELVTERAGGAILRGAGKVVSKVPGLSQLKSKATDAWMKTKPGRTMDEFNDLFRRGSKRAAWDGVLGEIGEERLGDISRGVLGDLGFGRFDYGTTGQLARGEQEGFEQLKAEALAFSVPGAPRTAANVGGVIQRVAQRLADIEAAQSKKFLSEQDGKDLGIKGGSRRERAANAKAEADEITSFLQQIDQEYEDEVRAREEKRVPDEQVPKPGEVTPPPKVPAVAQKPIGTGVSQADKDAAEINRLESELESQKAAEAAAKAPPAEQAPAAEVDEGRVDELLKTRRRHGRGARRETIRKEVAEEEAAAKKYPPGTELTIEGFKGSRFEVQPDGTLLETRTGRRMGDNAGAALRIYTPEQITVISKAPEATTEEVPPADVTETVAEPTDEEKAPQSSTIPESLSSSTGAKLIALEPSEPAYQQAAAASEAIGIETVLVGTEDGSDVQITNEDGSTTSVRGLYDPATPGKVYITYNPGDILDAPTLKGRVADVLAHEVQHALPLDLQKQLHDAISDADIKGLEAEGAAYPGETAGAGDLQGEARSRYIERRINNKEWMARLAGEKPNLAVKLGRAIKKALKKFVGLKDSPIIQEWNAIIDEMINRAQKNVERRSGKTKKKPPSTETADDTGKALGKLGVTYTPGQTEDGSDGRWRAATSSTDAKRQDITIAEASEATGVSVESLQKHKDASDADFRKRMREDFAGAFGDDSTKAQAEATTEEVPPADMKREAKPVPKPTKLQQRQAKAATELDGALKDLFNELDDTAFLNPVTPKAVKAFAKATYNFAKYGTLSAAVAVETGVRTFKKFLAEMTEKIGPERVDQFMPTLRGEWDKLQKTGDFDMEDIEAVEEPAAPKPPEPPASESEGETPDRSQFTGIKVERLEAQADARGDAHPTETESISAIKLVEAAVANRTVDSDEKAQALAREVIAKQKAITVEEAADLMASVDFHKREMEKATDEYNEHMANGEKEKADVADKKAAVHKAALNTVSQAAKDVGRRQFAALGHLFQVLVDRDGAAYIERDLRRANSGQEDIDAEGNDVIPEVAKEFADNLEEAKNKQAQAGKKNDQQESNAALEEKVQQLEEELKRERTRSRKSRGSKNRIVTEDAKNAAIQRIQDRFKAARSGSKAQDISGAAVDVALQVKDAGIVGAYLVEAGAHKLADFSRDMVAELGDWVKPHLKDLHRKARAEFSKVKQGDLKERLADAEDVRGQHGAVAGLAKEILAETRKDDGSWISRDELIDRLHEELKAFDPGITRRDAQDMLGGYGKWSELSKDELEVEYRNRRGEAREQSKIDDMRQKNPPKPSGGERHTPSAEESALTKEVTELKKQGEREGWYYSGDGENRLKGTKEAIKTRLKNEIRDLDSQISRGEKTAKNKSEPLTDPEIESLKQQRDQRKESLDAIGEAETARWDNEGGVIVDPAVEAYLKVLDRQEKALKKQLAEKDVFPKSGLPRPGGQRVDWRKARIEALKAEKALMRKVLDPNYETNQALLEAEKAAERQVAKLEQEEREGFKIKEKSSEPRPVSDKLTKARLKLDALREQRAEALEDEYALRAAVAQSKRNAANVAARIASGDFAPRKRKPARVFDDAEWQQARLDELAVRAEFAEKLAEYEWNNLTKLQRAGTYVNWAAVLQKGLLTTGDLAAHGIQLGPTMSTNPIVWAKSLWPTLKSISTKQRKLQDAKREADPDYELFVDWGVALGDTAAKNFFGNAEWIKKVPVIAFGERTFSTAINEVRFNLAKVMKWAYTKDGTQPTQEQGEAIARQVNVWTFGYKPPKDASGRRAGMRVAGWVLWSPPMYVARGQLLVGAPLWAMGADSKLRKIAAWQYIKLAVGTSALIAAARWLAGDDEDREWLPGPDDDEDTLYPPDVDFWKAKKGNKRSDWMSGLGQQAAYGARLLNSAWIARGGDPIWETRDLDTRDLAGSFTSYKLNPWAQAAFDVTSEKDVVGRPTSVLNIVVSGSTPLSVQNAIEAIEDSESVGEALPWAGQGFIGRNVNIYDKTAPKSEETFLSTVEKVWRQMTGEKPPGLKPDELKKWLENKVEWDTDLSGASKYLNEDQMEQARERREVRKQSIVLEATKFSGTRTQMPTTLESSLTREKARKTLKKTGWTHEEAQKLLLEHYKGKTWGGTDYKAKSKTLAALMFVDEAARIKLLDGLEQYKADNKDRWKKARAKKRANR